MRPLLVALITTCFSVGAIAQTGAPGKAAFTRRNRKLRSVASLWGRLKEQNYGPVIASHLGCAVTNPRKHRLLVQSSKFDNGR